MVSARLNRFELGNLIAPAAGLLALLLAGCEEKQQAAAPPPPPPEVVLAEVTQETVPIILQASGTIEAVKSIEVIPKVSGYIFERFFTEGTFVEEGAPLYLIDPRPFQDELAQLQSELKGQLATREFWKLEDERYSTLADKGFAAEAKADSARAKFLTTSAVVEATKIKIRHAKLDLSYTRITAPFYGRVQETRINVGNLVTKEEDVLTSLVMMDPIYVTFQLSRRQVYEVQKLSREGKTFALKDMVVEVTLSDDQIYGEKGQMNFFSTQIDPTTDSIKVRGIFKNPKNSELGDFDLIPGQYAPVRLTVGETPDTLVIPQVAVVETQSGSHVYVVGPDNKVEARSTELGGTYGTKRTVIKGLKQGEKIVVEGVQKVKAGAEVKPVEAAKPGQNDKAPEQG